MRFIGTCLITAILHFVSCAAVTSTLREITSIFEGLGYSPSCVASALASCESDIKLNNITDKSVPVSNNTILNVEKLLWNGRPKNCADLLDLGDSATGVRTVYPYNCCRDRKVTVYCDQTTDGGGWTVFQNRDALPIREDFYRTFVEYVLGFGNVTGEFWLGLDNIHALVGSTLMELRVDLEDYEGNKRYAKYGAFYVGDDASKYALSYAKYSGDAGDGFTNTNTIDGVSQGMKFSTHDIDNDLWSSNCAFQYRGAWWYRACHHSNLNGYQHVGQHSLNGEGINWYPFREWNYSLKKASMKIRPALRTEHKNN